MSDTNAVPFTAEEAREQARKYALSAAQCRSLDGLDDVAVASDRVAASWRLYAAMLERKPMPMVSPENNDPEGAGE